MTLTLTWHVQVMQLWKIHIHNKYQVSISTGSKVMAQTLNLTFDLAEWPWHYDGTTQNMLLYEIHLYTKYQMFISIGSKVMAKTPYLTFDLKEWPWPYIVTTQNVQPGDSYMYTKYQRSIPIGSNVMANVTYIFDLWPWRMTLTLTNYPSKCAAWADAYACQISSLYL